MKQRIHGLDLMRCFAVLSVVALHAIEAIGHDNSWVTSILQSGWIGVDCFFVLSGFLIGSQTFKIDASKNSPWVNIKTFWMRRWWRTLPLYFTALFVYAVVKPMLGYPFREFSWKFLVFFQNYDIFYDYIQSWSLCIEEHFYFFFPLFVFILGFGAKRPVVWIGFLLVSVFSRYWIWQQGILEATDPSIDFNVRFVTHYHLDGIAMGVFLASTQNHWKKLSQKVRLLIAAYGFFLVTYFPITVPYHLPGTSVIWMFTIVALGFSFVLIGLHDFRLPNRLVKPVQQIALWSYGMYIWNSLVIRAYVKMGFDFDKSLQLILFFVLSTLVAIPTYYLIEKPFLNYRNRLLEKL